MNLDYESELVVLAVLASVLGAVLLIVAVLVWWS